MMEPISSSVTTIACHIATPHPHPLCNHPRVMKKTMKEMAINDGAVTVNHAALSSTKMMSSTRVGCSSTAINPCTMSLYYVYLYMYSVYIAANNRHFQNSRSYPVNYFDLHQTFVDISENTSSIQLSFGVCDGHRCQ